MTKLAKKIEKQIIGLTKVTHLEVVHNQSTVKPFYVVEDAEVTGKNVEGWYFDETQDKPTEPFKIPVTAVIEYIEQFIGTGSLIDEMVGGEHRQTSVEYPAVDYLNDNTLSVMGEYLNAKGV